MSLIDSTKFVISGNIPDNFEVPDNIKTLVIQSKIVNFTFIKNFKKVKSIFCTKNTLESFEGLTENLYELVVSGNRITSFESLKINIIKLNCNENLIHSFVGLEDKVVYLNCKKNYLTSFNGLIHNMKFLDCSFNRIHSFASEKIRIQMLLCNSNLLTSFEGFNFDVVCLSVSNNKITSLEFLPLIKNVICSYNCLTSMNFTCVSKKLYSDEEYEKKIYMNLFDCSCNKIENFKGTENRIIKKLCCINNRIKSFEGLRNVTNQLNCSRNLISSFEHLKEGLTCLTCIENRFTSMSSLKVKIKNVRMFSKYQKISKDYFDPYSAAMIENFGYKNTISYKLFQLYKSEISSKALIIQKAWRKYWEHPFITKGEKKEKIARKAIYELHYVFKNDVSMYSHFLNQRLE